MQPLHNITHQPSRSQLLEDPRSGTGTTSRDGSIKPKSFLRRGLVFHPQDSSMTKGTLKKSNDVFQGVAGFDGRGGFHGSGGHSGDQVTRIQEPTISHAARNSSLVVK